MAVSTFEAFDDGRMGLVLIVGGMHQFIISPQGDMTSAYHLGLFCIYGRSGTSVPIVAKHEVGVG